MIHPLLSLAFSLASSPGVYALLLGSGVSRTAQIPTGWEIILDLTRQLARLEGAGELDDPERWYMERFGELPSYSRLLAMVAPSPAERQQLLKRYFEPTDAERAVGSKTPTAAHRAIAELVAGGAIRVVITTNFDRLLEQALEAAGIVPVVISSADGASGALPTQHARCTVIKLHGDYLDPRIRNTDDELATYDDVMNRLLDRVFDDHGLVVCGWSGDWDVALRAAIERCPSRRFTTYWMSRGALSDRAQQLITRRQGQTIAIAGADQAFQELAEKVRAIKEHNQPHPLSAPLAVASLKQYLSEDRHRIRLHDLVMNETERVYGQIGEELFPVQGGQGFATNEAFNAELLRQVRSYEALTDILGAMFITGCFWSEPHHDHLWAKSASRVANPPDVRGQVSTALVNLRRYPAVLLLYAGGIASIAADRYHTLKALLTHAHIREEYGRPGDHPVALVLYPGALLEQSIAQRLPGMEGHYTPMSDWLFATLREPLREIAPDDRLYERLFDRFEYLLALVHTDLDGQSNGPGRFSAPLGCFSWRYRREPQYISRIIQQEIESQQQAWLPLQAGLFGGSLERLRAVKAEFDDWLARATGRWC